MADVQLKDVIHLYNNPFKKLTILVDGKEIKYLWDVGVAIGGIVNFTAADNEFRAIESEVDDGWEVYNDDETLSRIKPFLRPFDDITDKELEERNFSSRSHWLEWCSLNKEWWPLEDLLWLIDNKFDVFGLVGRDKACRLIRKI